MKKLFKIQKLTKEMKKKIAVFTISFLAIVGISVGIFFAVRGGLQESIASAGKWAWLVYIVIRVILQTLLTFVPVITVLFNGIAIALFGMGINTFLICFFSVFFASMLMDLIGRVGGSKAIIKLVGQENYDKACELVDTHGKVYIPLMYLLPIFPDNAICMIAGASKIKWGLHMIFVAVFRGIGVATIVFGIGVIPPEVANFTSTNLWDYIEVITIIVVWIIILFKVAHWINNKIEQRKRKKDNVQI